MCNVYNDHDHTYNVHTISQAKLQQRKHENNGRVLLHQLPAAHAKLAALLVQLVYQFGSVQCLWIRGSYCLEGALRGCRCWLPSTVGLRVPPRRDCQSLGTINGRLSAQPVEWLAFLCNGLEKIIWEHGEVSRERGEVSIVGPTLWHQGF